MAVFDRLFSGEGVAVVAVIALLAFASGAALTGMFGSLALPGTGQEESVEWEGHITVEHNGEIIADFHNTLTTQGQNFIRDKIVGQDNTTGTAGISSLNASWIAVGNGTNVGSGDTILDKEITSGGLARDNGAVTTFSGGEFKVEHQFDATSDIGVVNTTSLNWNSTGPSIISGGAFGSEANILSGDSLTVTHNITISN